MSSPFINVKHAARITGLSEKYLYRLIIERKIGSYKVGRRVLLKEKDIEGFLEQFRKEPLNEVPNIHE